MKEVDHYLTQIDSNFNAIHDLRPDLGGIVSAFSSLSMCALLRWELNII